MCLLISDSASDHVNESSLTSNDEEVTGALATTVFPEDFETALDDVITVKVNENTSEKMMEECTDYAEGLCMFKRTDEALDDLESDATVRESDQCSILDCDSENDCKNAQKDFFKNNFQPGKSLGQ